MKVIKRATKVFIVWLLIAIVFTVSENYFFSGRLLAQTGSGNQTLNNPQSNNSSSVNQSDPHKNSHVTGLYIRRPRDPWGDHFGKSHTHHSKKTETNS